jgi:hypothetical protein
LAVLAIASAALYPSAINAAPGDLDQTFGTNGMSSINPIYAGSAAILLQPDGKIILTGSFDKQQSPYDTDVQLLTVPPISLSVQVVSRQSIWVGQTIKQARQSC